MSSILNALRKVEGESLHADKDQPESQRRIDAKRVIQSRHRHSQRRGQLLLLVIPVLTLLVALWVAWEYLPFPLSSKASPTRAKLSEPKNDEATLKEAFREEPGKRKPSDPAPSNDARDRNTTPKHAQEEKDRRGLPSKAPMAQQEGPSIEDPELKLQAIVWSESSENCFAVVNGVIVRVGGKVEGVSVVEIGKDHVSFKSGQRTWKMKVKTE